MKKSIFVALIALSLTACEFHVEAGHNKDNTAGEQARTVLIQPTKAGYTINQICVEGVYYLEHATMLTPQLDQQGGVVACEVATTAEAI